ncbi:Phosphate uptake regulator [Halalkaliarchaeum sp. AArc-CO]|uniref:phosphate signaling complex protein PhoU n=1 Tax=Halalkaliarchaeum sp. AArc-CO TaxID=2866381 RepID=UPI00217D6D11|nr:phosphate signaling complex protein PhoU [Halalkaliarchaeum sp. AArc-CO]UWG51715.1 Phosphate uptake regulator [Halalkaliarchaeum sp. AArc-CO]
MPRQEYQKQLAELRTDVIGMADLVLDRYELALQAYEKEDPVLAEAVIDGDDDVNDLYLDLERDRIELLALQQPVAGDLRFVAASFKIITDLERVADLATNLARYSCTAEGQLHQEVTLRQLADDAGEMVHDAVEAYEAEDVAACLEIARRDDSLDAACEAATERVLSRLVQSDQVRGDDDGALKTTIEGVSTALLTIRDLERVGDHAVNIAARSLYMIQNDDELLY